MVPFIFPILGSRLGCRYYHDIENSKCLIVIQFTFMIAIVAVLGVVE